MGMIQKKPDFRLAHVAWMAQFVVADIVADPVDIALLCPVTVMLASYGQAYFIK